MAWTSNVKSLIAEPTQEAWAAFAICLIKNVSIERAFDMLSGIDLNRKYKKWTEKDVQDVLAMKAQGMTYQEIADIYGGTKSNIAKVCERAKKK